MKVEKKTAPRWVGHILGEAIGTFLMCFLGIGAVAVATLFNAYNGPFQVGMIWGITIAIAIYVTRNLSSAHFNPSVTLAMCLSGRCAWKNFPIYLCGQMIGALTAATSLWIFFKDSVMSALASDGIGMNLVSGPSSIWCEVFPNTANGVIPLGVACFAEGLGVFILVTIIFSLTEGCNVGRPNENISPLFIGFTITCLIGTIGPMTNAGLNPIRDLAPRIVGYIVGFRDIAFSLDAFLVYFVSPFVGAALASIIFTKAIEPMQNKSSSNNTCSC